MKLSHFEAIKEDSVPEIYMGTAEAGTVGTQGDQPAFGFGQIEFAVALPFQLGPNLQALRIVKSSTDHRHAFCFYLSATEKDTQPTLEEPAEIFAVFPGGFTALDNHLRLLARLDPRRQNGGTTGNPPGGCERAPQIDASLVRIGTLIAEFSPRSTFNVPRTVQAIEDKTP
jgi:hypothetical protein